MAVLWCGSGRVNKSKRIVKGVSIFIPILRVIQKSIEEIVGRFFRQSTYFHALPNDHRVVWIGGHEAAEVGGVEAGAEVVEAALGIAFFAGEVHRAGVGAASARGLAVPEGKTSDGFTEAAADAGASALRAEPIRMDEVSGAVIVGGQVTRARVDFAAVPPAA